MNKKEKIRLIQSNHRGLIFELFLSMICLKSKK